jgi:plastocyanin
MMAFIRTSIALIAIAALSIGIVMAAHAGDSTAEPTEHVMEITGFKFIPESLSVKAGDTIKWINKDITPHTAIGDDMSFDTGQLKQNESKNITVSSDQKISYVCRFHPAMKAKWT